MRKLILVSYVVDPKEVSDFALVAIEVHPAMDEAEELKKAEAVFRLVYKEHSDNPLISVHARPTFSLQEDHRDEILGATLEIGKGYQLNQPKVRPLQAPANHTLQECLAELKFGRPAAGQKFLDKCIAELNGDSQEEGKISINLAARMLHKFWNSSSDACPLEATEQERQEQEFSDYVHSKVWANEEGNG